MATAKVAIFVDGKNFYEGLRASGLQSKIDFSALADLMVKGVRGSVLTGLHYFTGVEPRQRVDDEKEDGLEKKKSLEGFLSFLETQPGCFVYRFPRRVRSVTCNQCGHEHSYTEEKAVDTSLVATMIRQAAIGAFDYAVLCSGDADHTPALEALRDLGKPTWVATFGGHGLSRRLQQAAYGHIDLSHTHKDYSFGEDEMFEELDVKGAVEEAQDYFGEDRYVGFNFFVNEWRTKKIPRDPSERRTLIQEAIENGVIEAYEAEDGCRAIRVIAGTE